MTSFLYKTNGNADPKGKPRVFFTCHPKDFSLYFEKICEDLLKAHDCAVYYTEDPCEPIDGQGLETDLGQMNLLVVPVTLRLLHETSRAMDQDVAFAKRVHIPILPFMMESGLEELYSRPDRFGEMQYLSPYSSDITEIRYEEKLKRYLESVLIGSEQAERIRAAFNAYIFLSYRKKDRYHANELMRLIHEVPECRDVAIWYDEFLTPGESFRENIGKALEKSKLFTLLITPNVLEEPNGKPNFVMGEEYPTAKQAGMKILPVEMVPTDRARLEEKFNGISACVDPKSGDALRKTLTASAIGARSAAHGSTPEHEFLIGLAYLDGVDVEVNRARALELITSAANAGLAEAMEKLYFIYGDGIGVAVDYAKATEWCERLVECRRARLGEEHPDTLAAMNKLGMIYRESGKPAKARGVEERAYELKRKVLGEEHPDTLHALNNLCVTCSDLGELQVASALAEKEYALMCKTLGEEHPYTVHALNNLAMAYDDAGDYRKALETAQRVYALSCRLLGEEDPDTLLFLSNIGLLYHELREFPKALETLTRAYTLQCKVQGEEAPDTLVALNGLSTLYSAMGEHQKALETAETVYTLRCKTLGEKHPQTLTALNNIAMVHGEEIGNLPCALEELEKAHALYCEVLGEKHPTTLAVLGNLAMMRVRCGDLSGGLEDLEKAYALHCEVLGEEHPDTLIVLSHLAVMREACMMQGGDGDSSDAMALLEKVHLSDCKILGEEHPETLNVLSSLGLTRAAMGDLNGAKQALERFCSLREEEATPEMLSVLSTLYYAYEGLGDSQRAQETEARILALNLRLFGTEHPTEEEMVARLLGGNG